MRLAAQSRIIGALALALTAAALVPGTSAGYRLTHQEIARLAHQSLQDPASVAQAPVLRPNPDQQVVQGPTAAAAATERAQGLALVGVNRAKEVQEAELSRASTSGGQSGVTRSSVQAANVPGKHGLAPRYPVAASSPSVKGPGNGFDYGDAGVGAGIAAMIVLLATAGAMTVRRRSQPHHG